MKQGDTVPVTIAGQVVAQATVKEVSEGEVTLVVPGTLVRMATRTQLAPEQTQPDGAAAPSVEHQITGVDRAVPQEVEAVESGTPEVPAPVVTDPGEVSENAPVVETVQAVEQTNPTVSDNAAQNDAGNANPQD